MTLTAETRKILIVAPLRECVPGSLRNVTLNSDWHKRTVAGAQQLRGRIYVEEGAIEPAELTSDGRLFVEGDDESWHLLVLDPNGEVCGCARYLSHENTTPFSRLGVRHAAAAQPEIWGQKLRWAIEADLQLARKRSFAFVEVGGWALREDMRHSTTAVQLVLTAYALARHLNGCIGVTTATVRHGSSTILRRMGGQKLQVGGIEMPTYQDPRYKCEMAILRFDSDRPNPRYERWVEQIREELIDTPVVGPGSIHRVNGGHIAMASAGHGCTLKA